MKISKVTVVALFALGVNANANANFLINFLAKKLMKDSYSHYHGEGVPKKVGENPYAVEFRKNFMDENGIAQSTDELGLEEFTGNKIGLALLKKSNEGEAAFQNVLAKKNYQTLDHWKNGPQFLKALERYTEENGCIPKLMSISHGWRSEGRRGEGNGLSGDKGINGIFATTKDLPSSTVGKWGTRSLDRDMKKMVDEGKIKFCGSCVAEFYACNIGTEFADSFAKVSGCQTVVSTGQSSPWFQKADTREDEERVYRGSHYWMSASGVWAESESEAKKHGWDELGTWYRSTPVKNDAGQVTDLVKENLGDMYISI